MNNIPLLALLLPITYFILFCFIIQKSSFFDLNNGIKKKYILAAFSLKVLAGTALWFIYTYYYTDRSTADIFKYFDDAKIIYASFKENTIDYFKILFGIRNDNAYFDETYYHKMMFWSKSLETSLYNESHTIIRFNAFTMLFSLGNYHVHTVFICFLSLIGIICIYKTFSGVLDDKLALFAVSLVVLPSLLLWASGVLKESLALFVLGLTLFVGKTCIEAKGIRRGLAFALLIGFLYLMLLVKMYTLSALIPGLLAWWWTRKRRKYVFLKFLIVHSIYFLVIFNLKGINDYYTVVELISIKQNEAIELAKEQQAGSLIKVSPIEPTFISVLCNSPLAFFNTLTRPHIFEVRSPIILLAAIENTLLLVLVIISMISANIKKVARTPEFYLCAFYVIISFTIVGLTTPVAGAIVRYRVTALPFLVIVCFMLLDTKKLKQILHLKK